MTPEDIISLKRNIDQRECQERDALLREHNQKFYQERLTLYTECGKIGHVKGRFWDNGWGTTWCYCARCGCRMTDTIEHYET